MDYIPQHDAGVSRSHTAAKSTRMNPQQEAHARAMVSKLSREELEDQYLRSQEENIVLKRHSRKQDEKIKRISTKLIRLVNDRKKWSAETGTPGKRSTREVSLEETIETQQDQIRKLQKDNEMLKQKLHVANQQLLTQGRRHTPYGHVQSRINSGIERRPFSARERSKTGTRSKSPGQDSFATSVGPRYGHSLLEEAREENKNMQNVIIRLQEQLANAESENNQLQNELRLKNVAHEDDVLKFKEHLNSNKKTTLGENIELIRIQRELKEKSSAFNAMEARYRELQDTHQNIRLNYDKVLQEMEHLKSRLHEEESRSFSLQSQMKGGGTSQRKTAELQQTIYDLERELEILKDANERLTNNAFASGQEQKWRHVERELRSQIAQLEAVVQYDLKDKDSVLQKAANERAMNDRMQNERRVAHEECSRLRVENQELRNRLRLLSSLDDAVDVVELEEALAVIRQKRHLAAERKRPDFLESYDESKDLDTLYNELQVQHADTVRELEKTREMLLMQHKINKDYQIEVESVSNKMEQMKREYEDKLEHFAQLLDARAARVKKLEKQLHDVAYGTKQFKYKPEDEDEVEAENETFDFARLERGENLLEISITKVSLSRDAIQAIDDREPSTFITFAFYDYELVSTPIIKSGSPRFDFTSQYIVKVDDLLLHHLQKDSTLVELHQAFGTEYTTICACKIRFNQLLDKPQGKLHGTAILTGIKDGANYGTLDFWVRLRVPMDQAIRLYKERTKALGYLSANTATTQKHLDAALTMQPPEDNFNQLDMQIMSCNHVQARRPGVQPNVYCVYKFFDFADHDTVIIPNSNNPHFDDHQSFPVQMSSDLDAYLKSEKLVIYVFDDADPDIASYLGKATVDLIPLAHNKVIKAPFQLYKPDESENGTVEISMRWKVQYKAPDSVMKIPESDSERREKQQQQQMIPEKLVPVSKVPASKQTMPQTQKTTKPAKSVHSTPKPKVSQPEIKEIPISPVESSSVKTVEEARQPQPVVKEVKEKEPEPAKVLPQPKARTLKPAATLEKHFISEEETIPKRISDDETIPQPVPQKVKPVKIVQPVKKESELEDSALEDSIQEDITEDLDEDVTDADDIETDTDSVVIMQSPNVTSRMKTDDQIRISVNHLAIHPESTVWKNPDIQRLFIEYTFLGDVEETPVALPKPSSANQEISYNFSKVVHVDAESNEEKRNHLAAMILQNSGVESTIGFVVVSEPQDEENECEELGEATVDLNQILMVGQDVNDADIDVMDENEVIGRLNVSVEAVAALNSVVKEVHHLVEQQKEK
ncbi:protein fantom-like [Styela clava]